jgi:hypothetical protein
MIWIGNKDSSQVINGQKYKEVEGELIQHDYQEIYQGNVSSPYGHLLIASFRLEITCSLGNMGHPHYWHNDDLLSSNWKYCNHSFMTERGGGPAHTNKREPLNIYYALETSRRMGTTRLQRQGRVRSPPFTAQCGVRDND